MDLVVLDADVRNVQRHQLADADAGGEEQLEDDVVADGAEVAVAPAGGVIARSGERADLVFGSGQERAHFARRQHGRNAVLDRLANLQLAGRRFVEDALLFKIAEEDFQRGDFAADRRIAVRSRSQFVEVLLEMFGRDVDHVGAIHVHVKLAQVRLVRADRAIGKIPHSLPMLQKIGDRFLHVHHHALRK